MSSNEPRAESGSVHGTAAALRRAFDESFSVPATLKAESTEGLLAIRVASDPYAVHLTEIAGLYVDLKIVPVPSPIKQLLGIVGIRGTMAPIYDLAALLGYPPTASPRWIVFARGARRVGLAFETFESHLQVPQATLAGDALGTGANGRHMRGTVRAAGALRPILLLTSVVATLEDNDS